MSLSYSKHAQIAHAPLSYELYSRRIIKSNSRDTLRNSLTYLVNVDNEKYISRMTVDISPM